MGEYFSEIAIVLTGTIIPNTKLHTKYFDADARRAEYLKAIHFYKDFAPVYFLENSDYALDQDQEFINIPNVEIYRFRAPLVSKGKGFQEFNMLDRWIHSNPNPPKRWIKITGRYLYNEFENIFDECSRNNEIGLIINQYLFANHADTALFCVDTHFYNCYLANLYLRCDDSRGILIENVVSNQLKEISKRDFRRFESSLHCKGIAGHSGKEIHNYWLNRVNTVIRNINYKFDKHYIWLSF